MSFPPIASLVPHRAPMLLLDEVCSADEASIACRVVIGEASPFAEGRRVRGVIALEYMAQCVGAFAGLKAQARGEPVRVGYLIGAKEVVLDLDHFDVGDELRVEARHLFGDRLLGQFACRVVRAGRTVADATLSVHMSQDEGT